MSDVEEITPPPRPKPVIIDLMSDDEAEPEPSPPRRKSPSPELPFGGDMEPFNHRPANRNMEADWAFPAEEDYLPFLNHDEQPQQQADATQESHDRDLAWAVDDDATFTAEPSNSIVTADDCLQRVLEIFPDISHEHVVKLYSDFDVAGDYEVLPGPARLDNIIEQLVSAASYPRQERQVKAPKKRKREESDETGDLRQWERGDRVPVPHFLIATMRSMLKAEFPDIGVTFLNDQLKEHKHYFQAHVVVAYLKDTNDPSVARGRPPHHLADAETIAINATWPALLDELNAARDKVMIVRAGRAAEDAVKQAEQENLQRAIEAGETAECQCCFDELPMNRQIHCNGLIAHFTCFSCAETYIKTEVGESRCRVLCTAGCNSGFAQAQLNLLSDKKLLEKLAQLEQEKAIRDAGLDNLEECPFCEYKAILPPIEEDFEFRCANPECEKVSCRRCKAMSHIPMSCEEHAKDNKIDQRHKIEEAMTAALIRSCNKCKKQFIKEYGCNKMTCPSCANLQCYVCSQSLTNYDHFDHAPQPRAPGQTLTDGKENKKCPLHDNVEERHEREVKTAEEAARRQVIEENPDVSPEDLEFKVSDAVKKSTETRINAARAGMPPGFGFAAGMPAHLAHMGPYGAFGGGLDGMNEGEEDEHMARHRAVRDRLRAHQAQLRQARQAQIIQEQMLREQMLMGQRNEHLHGRLPDLRGRQPPPPVAGYIPVHLFPAGNPGAVPPAGYPAYPAPAAAPRAQQYLHDPFARAPIPGAFAQEPQDDGVRGRRQAFMHLEEMRRDYDQRMGRHRH